MEILCHSIFVDPSVRGLCGKPYPLHPKGCPNLGKRKTCPPKAPLIYGVFDIRQPIYAIINEFNLECHIRKMATKHPDWSARQLRCVLYWQGTARKQLRDQVQQSLKKHPGFTVTYCPEAMGLDVTKTLRAIGVELEWPPEKIVRQVALMGVKK